MSQSQTIADLEAHIAELEHEEEQLRESLARTQMEQWEGHLDDLQVQVRLGAMEVRDRLDPIVDRVRGQVAEARSRVETGGETASEAAAAIRSGVEAAWRDMRAALAEAQKIVTG
jgi:hypothetical protein